MRKKGGGVLIIILLLAISISEVSGEEKIAVELPNTTFSDVPVAPWCNDTDNGTSYFISGEVFSDRFPKGKRDQCFNSLNGKTYLSEGICRDNRYLINLKNCAELGKEYFCDQNQGICASNSTPDRKNNFSGICNDTDGGISYFKAGEVFSERYPGGLQIIVILFQIKRPTCLKESAKATGMFGCRKTVRNWVKIISVIKHKGYACKTEQQEREIT